MRLFDARAVIEDVVVHERYRGLGIAALLTREALARARLREPGRLI